MNAPNSFDDFKETNYQMLTTSYDFIKHLVTTASAVLAILISLSHQPSHNTILLGSLVLLALSILCGTLVLYIVLFSFRKTCMDILESIDEQANKGARAYKPFYPGYNTVAKILEVVCVSSFIIAMLLLVIISFTKL